MHGIVPFVVAIRNHGLAPGSAMVMFRKVYMRGIILQRRGIP